MRLRTLKSDDIRRLLEEGEDSFPSDYSDGTDEEWEGADCESHNPLDRTEDIQIVIDDDVLPEETILTISDSTTHQEKTKVSGESHHRQTRKWRLKPEPASDTEFQPSGFMLAPNATTPLETFLNFFDCDILK